MGHTLSRKKTASAVRLLPAELWLDSLPRAASFLPPNSAVTPSRDLHPLTGEETESDLPFPGKEERNPTLPRHFCPSRREEEEMMAPQLIGDKWGLSGGQ